MLEFTVVVCFLRINVNNNNRVHKVVSASFVIKEGRLVKVIFQNVSGINVFPGSDIETKFEELNTEMRVLNSSIKNDVEASQELHIEVITLVVVRIWVFLDKLDGQG